MAISYAFLAGSILATSLAGYAAQSAAGLAAQNPPAQASVSSERNDAPAPAERPSIAGLLQPSLDRLQQAMGVVQLEKWKKGPVRDEAAANISSIQKDLGSTLPALIKDAESGSRSLSKQLPVSRNIDALYDVVLRVVDGARVAGPGDEYSQLLEAMAGLEKTRHAFNDQVQESAIAQEKQVSDLQSTLKARAEAAPVCPVATSAPAAEPAPAAKKKVVRKKPRPATPATPGQPPANAPAAGASKPNS